jgi:hypothetical protein
MDGLDIVIGGETVEAGKMTTLHIIEPVVIQTWKTPRARRT